MAKYAQKPDHQFTAHSVTSFHSISPTQIARQVLQKEENRGQEVTHVIHDLRKTLVMIVLLTLAQAALYFLLTKHIMTIPSVKY